MRIAILFLVLLSTLVATGVAHGQEPLTLPAVGETLALERNDRAPWTGMLVRDEDLFALQSLVLSTRLELQHARTMADEVLAGRASLLATAETLCAERVALHDVLWTERRDELAEALRRSREREGPEWYEHPALWFAVGVLVTGAVSIGVVSAVSS